MLNIVIPSQEVSATPKKIKPWVLLCATALAFALGWAAAQLLSYATDGKHGQAQTSSAAGTTAGAAKAGVALDALSQFKATDWNTQQPAGMEQLAAALPGNAALRQAALARYRQEPYGLAKINLGQLLAAQALPEVMSAASGWAQQADSAAARADGFHLLRQMPPQPATYLLARHAVEHEQDPVALAAAVWAIAPVGIPDPVEVKRLVPRLHSLTQHPLADVRSASIQRLAEWDRARLHFTQDALRLMADANYDVRLAAVGATSIAALTEDAVKRQFFAILGNPKEEAELRSIILMQLERFTLSPKEYATYQAVQTELFGKAKGSDR